MSLPEADFLKLRNEAIACLTLSDVRMTQEGNGWPIGSHAVNFDSEQVCSAQNPDEVALYPASMVDGRPGGAARTKMNSKPKSLASTCRPG